MRVFHLQIAPETQTTSNDTVFSLDDMRFITRAAGPRLEQIGFFNKIFRVKRTKTLDPEVTEEKPRGWSRLEPLDSEHDVKTIRRYAEHEDVDLEPWRKGTMTVPEIFQVWRV